MTDMSSDPTEPQRRRRSHVGTGIAVGVAIGVALGTAFDQLALGLALGIAFGAAIDVVSELRRRVAQPTDRGPKAQNGGRA